MFRRVRPVAAPGRSLLSPIALFLESEKGTQNRVHFPQGTQFRKGGDNSFGTKGQRRFDYFQKIANVLTLQNCDYSGK